MTSKRTKAVQAGIGEDRAFNAVTPPLYLSTNYVFPSFGDVPTYDYGRGGNPNRDQTGAAIAELEGGATGQMCASGMAALDLVTNLVTADQLILAPHDCYGGTHRLLSHRAKQGRFRVAFIDQTDADALSAAIAERPSLVMVETPSNPLMRLTDIAAVVDAAHGVGAKVVVDNTFLSPVRQLPLDLGADFVVHSTTKFLNGHSDSLGGCLVSRDAGDGETLAWWANATGVTGAPFDSWLTLRGMRTLSARVDAAEASAVAIVDWLRGQDRVSEVYFPDGNDLARRQQSGPGAMASFRVTGNPAKLCEALSIFQFAESLGGTESLLCHPATMTHRGMDARAREAAGVGHDLLRISVGLESVDDLLADLGAGFAAMSA